MIQYDEDRMFPVSRALFYEMRSALRFYARQANYREHGSTGIEPVMRDHGKRAAQAVARLDDLMRRHERALGAKYEAEDRRKNG
jgi:hypothetical protein